MKNDCKTSSYWNEESEMNTELEHTRSNEEDVDEAEDDKSKCGSHKMIVMKLKMMRRQR